MEFKYSNLSFYNRNELLNRLNISKEKFSNEELLLKAYEYWGEKFFHEINGDFAFALYNSSTDEVFAARDHLGIKALYYTLFEGKYYFSDNIDEFFELGVEKKPNIKSIRTLLEQRAVDYEDTMYEGIHRVPPGHYVKVLEGKVILARYWFPEKIETDYKISLNDAAIKFKQLFEKAIFSRLGEDQKTAYELSGGLDSSSIVSMVKTIYPKKKIDTYSMFFEGFQCDESQYISKMEEKYKFSTVKVNAGEIDYKNKFDFNFNYRMSPHWPITTTFTMSFSMIEKMKNDGKKIIITGQGGDHLLTGNCYSLADLLRRLEFLKTMNELAHRPYAPRGLLRCSIFPLLSREQKEFFKRLFSPFFKRKNVMVNEQVKDLFHLESISSATKRSDIHFLISAAQSTMFDGNIFHAIESAYNIESRHPFFDKKLVEFVLSLPPEYKYSKGRIKVLLRNSMKGILPEEIRLRKDKAEFSEVLVQQLNAIDFSQILKNSNLVLHGLVEQKTIQKLVQSFNNKDYTKVVSLWMIVNIEYWYQHIVWQKC